MGNLKAEIATILRKADSTDTLLWVDAERMAEALVAVGYRRPRTITTEADLDALPVGSVVVEASGDLCQRFGSGWAGIIQEPDGELWLMRGAEDLELPAIVLHGSDDEPSDYNWGDQAGAVL